MKYEKRVYPDNYFEIYLSIFSLKEGIDEYHAVIRIVDNKLGVNEQYEQIEKALLSLENEYRIKLIWKRYFVSDAANQQSYLKHDDKCHAVSVVQQPPLNGTKVAVWAYLLPDISTIKDKQGATTFIHNSYQHLFHTQQYIKADNESEQTSGIFNRYIRQLTTYNCTLADNCIRTWIYVQGIDNHYQGMVTARKDYFEKEGLTPLTHYIASTGIEGKYIDTGTLVFMDAYAIKGLQSAQIHYLIAPANLNPTHEYGVTFERGTMVQYGDRRHVFISGTASINNRGEIEHANDILGQAARMFGNIRALLADADCSMDNVTHLIVYLRDTADFHTVNGYMKRNYPQIPVVILWAPVCRPGWLIEAECMAIVNIGDKRFYPY